MYALILVSIGWIVYLCLFYKMKVKSKLSKSIMIILFIKIIVLAIIYFTFFNKKKKITPKMAEQHFISKI